MPAGSKQEDEARWFQGAPLQTWDTGISGPVLLMNSEKGQPKKNCIKFYLITAHLHNSGCSLALFQQQATCPGPTESIAMVNHRNSTNITSRSVNTWEGRCQQKRSVEEKLSFVWAVELEVFNGKHLCRQRTEKVKASHGDVKLSVLDEQFWIQSHGQSRGLLLRIQRYDSTLEIQTVISCTELT